MAWDSWPPFFLPSPPNAQSLSSNFQLHNLLIQLAKASRQRNVASADALSDPHWSGQPRHPRHNMVWDSGIVTAISATSITIGGKTWDTTGTFNNPWASVNVHNPDPPSSFDIVIDDCDFKRVIHTQVSLIQTGNTVTVPDMSDFVTQRVVPDLASRIGKKAFIIKRAGLWWSERILQWPNDLILWLGSMSVADEVSITSDSGSWTVNQWAGKDVVFQDAIGQIDRGRISSNTANVLSFATERSLFPAGRTFYIVNADALLQWDRIADIVWAWNFGAAKDYYSHYPGDANPSVADQNVSFTPKVKLQGTYTGFDGVGCSPLTFNSIDNDFWSDQTETCSEPDDPKNPDTWRALLRQTQVHIEQLAERGSFIDPTRNYDGVTVRPSSFRAATLFAKAGVNAQASVTGTHIGSSGINVKLQIPAFMRLLASESLPVHWAILDGNGNVMASGTPDTGGNWQNGVLAGNFSEEVSPATNPVTYKFEGKKVVVSLGETRYMFREFLYFYDKTVFIPDTDVDGNIVDPPTTTYPGRWVTRPNSSYYVEHSATGFVQTSSLNRDQIDFNGSAGDGVLARFIGENWNDPGINNGSQWFDGTANVGVVKSWNRFFCGRHASAVQSGIDNQRSGTATSGTLRSLTDTNQDWWTKNWYLGGVLLTLTGTPTSFTSTSFTDTTQAGSSFFDPAKNWLVGLIAEVKIAGVWYRRPITGHVGQTVSWSESVAGTITDWKIRAPKYERNRWAGGRKVVITWPDQSTQTVAVDYSDDNTLYFNAPLNQAIVAGCSYSNDEAQPGTVWKRSGGQWVKPTGVDQRSQHWGSGQAIAFEDDQRMNAPTIVNRYGRFMKGDLVGLPLLIELYDCFNWLQWTIGDFGWTTRHDPAVVELNNREDFEAGGPTFDNSEFYFRHTYVWDQFDLLTPGDPSDNNPPGNPIEGSSGTGGFWGPTSLGNVPMCVYLADAGDIAWASEAFITDARVYGYGTVTLGNGDNCPVTSQTFYYVMVVAPFTDLSTQGTILAGAVLADRTFQIIDTYDSSGGHIHEYIWQFDANGDAVQAGGFRLFSSSNADYPAGEGLIDRRSSRLGSNGSTPPNRPIDGTNKGPYAVIRVTSSRGWEAVQWFQITRWNFTQAIPVNQLIEGGTLRSDKPQPQWFSWWMQ